MATTYTCTYVIEEPFDRALKRLRTALAASGVITVGELDFSARIRGALMVKLPPCVLLFAATPAMRCEEAVWDECGAAVLPIHLVISGRGPRTEIHFLKALPHSYDYSESRGFEAARALRMALCGALEGIGRRQLDT